jgi:hypothetical protein
MSHEYRLYVAKLAPAAVVDETLRGSREDSMTCRRVGASHRGVQHAFRALALPRSSVSRSRREGTTLAKPH